jgi:hypothetical protein
MHVKAMKVIEIVFEHFCVFLKSENATACGKHTLKTTVATQLKSCIIAHDGNLRRKPTIQCNLFGGIFLSGFCFSLPTVFRFFDSGRRECRTDLEIVFRLNFVLRLGFEHTRVRHPRQRLFYQMFLLSVHGNK